MTIALVNLSFDVTQKEKYIHIYICIYMGVSKNSGNVPPVNKVAQPPVWINKPPVNKVSQGFVPKF